MSHIERCPLSQQQWWQIQQNQDAISIKTVIDTFCDLYFGDSYDDVEDTVVVGVSQPGVECHQHVTTKNWVMFRHCHSVTGQHNVYIILST